MSYRSPEVRYQRNIEHDRRTGMFWPGRIRSLSLALIVFTGLLPAQVLDNHSLNGRYHFIHLLATVTTPGVTKDVNNLSGTITFDGAGSFTFSGDLGRGQTAPEPLSGSGVYSVAPTGLVSLDNVNPNAARAKIDARLGDGGEILLGSTTRAADGFVDFFVALRAPAMADTRVLNGEYTAGSLGFLNASQAGLASVLLTFTVDGGGTIPRVGVFGHAVDVAGDVNLSEEIRNVAYSIGADGAGTATFGGGFGDGSGLFFGLHDIFVSSTGTYVIGSSRDPRVRQVFVGVRNFGSNADNQAWSGDYWIAEIAIDTAGQTPAFQSYNGGLRGIPGGGQGTVILSESTREISEKTGAGGATFDIGGREPFRIDSNSRGSRGSPGKADHVNMAVGVAKDGRADAFVGVQVGSVSERSQRHGLFFGVRAPTLTGGGVFVNPLGIVNGASFAIPPFPIAPGSVVALFGTKLAPDGTDARPQTPAPLPASLSGVSVLVDGTAAPLYSVRPDQINFQLPFTAKAPSVQIAVSNNGNVSNPVEVKVAATSPGVFLSGGGSPGSGAVTHSDFSLVSREHPAERGEWISIFLTGLGEVSPAVPEGVAAPSSPLSELADREGVRVLFNRIPATEIGYVGLAPNLVGTYQMNVRIPSDASLGGTVSIEIETRNARSALSTLEIAGQP